jgi:hypothetical protein
MEGCKKFLLISFMISDRFLLSSIICCLASLSESRFLKTSRGIICNCHLSSFVTVCLQQKIRHIKELSGIVAEGICEGLTDSPLVAAVSTS